MSYDGSGTYSLPSPQYPAVSGALIKAADYNTILMDLAAALSACMVRDGQSVATGSFSMGGKKITGLAAGSVAGDAVRYEQLTAVITAALAALGALTPSADKFPYFTGASTADMLTIVAAIRAVLASADVAAMRSNMGVAYGTTAGTVAEGNHLHSGVYEPADATILKTAAIGVTVQGYDATTLKAAAIGTTVQAYDANTMKSNVVTARTRAHLFTPVGVIAAAGGALAIDCDLHEECYITLAETTTTVGQASNQARGKYVVLEVTGTTGKSLAWNSNWRVDGAACTIAAPANGVKDIHCFRSDGTAMIYIGSKWAV
jgi:hypothetical protein